MSRRDYVGESESMDAILASDRFIEQLRTSGTFEPTSREDAALAFALLDWRDEVQEAPTTPPPRVDDLDLTVLKQPTRIARRSVAVAGALLAMSSAAATAFDGDPLRPVRFLVDLGVTVGEGIGNPDSDSSSEGVEPNPQDLAGDGTPEDPALTQGPPSDDHGLNGEDPKDPEGPKDPSSPESTDSAVDSETELPDVQPTDEIEDGDPPPDGDSGDGDPELPPETTDSGEPTDTPPPVEEPTGTPPPVEEPTDTPPPVEEPGDGDGDGDGDDTDAQDENPNENPDPDPGPESIDDEQSPPDDEESGDESSGNNQPGNDHQSGEHQSGEHQSGDDESDHGDSDHGDSDHGDSDDSDWDHGYWGDGDWGEDFESDWSADDWQAYAWTHWGESHSEGHSARRAEHGKADDTMGARDRAHPHQKAAWNPEAPRHQKSSHPSDSPTTTSFSSQVRQILSLVTSRHALA